VCAQTKEFAAEDVEGQAEQVMLNLGAVLEAAGSSFGKARARAQPRSLLQRDLERELRRRRRALAQVAKTTVLLASMDDFAKVNAVYSAPRCLPDVLAFCETLSFAPFLCACCHPHVHPAGSIPEVSLLEQ